MTESLSESYPPLNLPTHSAPSSASRSTPASSVSRPASSANYPLPAVPTITPTPVSDNYTIEPRPSEQATPDTEPVSIKPELPVAEVINIKEELMETPQYPDNSALSQILSSDHINQLMSNVVGELSTVDTPLYVTANKAANPLSMLHLQNNPSSMLGKGHSGYLEV